jgi:two-component system response regulator HydG
MRRAAVLSANDIIQPSDLPSEIHKSQTEGNFFVIPFGTTLDEIERIVISETLRRTNGDKKLVGQLLGIATRTVYRKIESLQAEKDEETKENDETPSLQLLPNEHEPTNPS